MTVVNQNVFINCPFDDDYKPLFEAIRFTVQACGYIPRCALEENDGTDARLDKIVRLIRDCSLSIHDLSRTEIDARSGMPRFNMPYELGLYMGAKRFGGRVHKPKTALIMVQKRYGLPAYLSDMSGSDPLEHEGKINLVIEGVRDYLHVGPVDILLPGAAHIYERLKEFQQELPELAKAAKLKMSEVDAFKHYRSFDAIVSAYLKNNPVLEES